MIWTTNNLVKSLDFQEFSLNHCRWRSNKRINKLFFAHPKDIYLFQILEIFKKDLFCYCDALTTACPDHWSEENRAHGHCAVFALLVQKFFGGSLLRASLEELSNYQHIRSHYWNLLPNAGIFDPEMSLGTVDLEIDLSSDQLGVDRELVPDGEFRTREYVLSSPDTKKRYDLLESRLSEHWFR
ncbi:hypothetical protein GW950_00625 [Candidatus Wolfebacteria bacterium]|nr:hypothetical protein [Candidatus Wolfebacteria bacterium]